MSSIQSTRFDIVHYFKCFRQSLTSQSLCVYDTMSTHDIRVLFLFFFAHSTNPEWHPVMTCVPSVHISTTFSQGRLLAAKNLDRAEETSSDFVVVWRVWENNISSMKHFLSFLCTVKQQLRVLWNVSSFIILQRKEQRII